MARLDPAIRIRRWELDEQRRALGQLREAERQLELELQALEQQKEAEAKAARQAPDFAMTYGAYAQHIKEKRQALQAQLAQLQIAIAAATDQVREQFRACKSLEMVEEKRIAAEKAARDKKESAVLDEVGLENHRRKQRDSSS